MEIKVRKRGRRKGQSGKKWTKEDLDFLRESYLFFTDEELSKVLGRSPKTLHTIRKKYGWLKTKHKIDKNSILNKTPIIFLHRRGEFVDNDRKGIEDYLNMEYSVS